MVFAMVPPWRWLLRKFILATSFGSFPHGFPAMAHHRDYERLIEDFFGAANSIAFIF